MRDEIARTCGSVDAAAFDSFVDWLRKLYRVEMPKLYRPELQLPARSAVFASRCCPTGTTRRLRPAWRGGAEAVRRPARPSTVQFSGCVRRTRARLGLALYAVITYMDTIEGVWFPEGGIHAVPTMMAQVAEKAGVTFRYDEPVETILRSQTGRVAGVRTTSGERIMADAVVCTLDLPTAHEELLSDLRPPRATRRVAYSASAVLWHVGVPGMPEASVAHHNIHFGEEWARPLRR
jgi:phytoene desaturase